MALKTHRRASLEADRTALLVPLEDIRPGDNARRGWDVVDPPLKQFAESIRGQGILEPLLVREVTVGASPARRVFQLVAGYRRYTAARYLELARVPVRVLATRDDEAVALNLAENLAREGLAETDAMRAVETLKETYGWGVRQIARATGRHPSWISALLTVSRSRPEREAVARGQVGIEAAARMVRLKDPFPERREALLRRLDAGERVHVHDVPRLTQLKDSSGAPLDAGREAYQTTGVAVSKEALELGRGEQSLVHNLRRSTLTVLGALSALGKQQGGDRALPPTVRADLDEVRRHIGAFLDAWPDGRRAS